MMALPSLGASAVKARILVTSASGANGDGYGTLLGFAGDGEPSGLFSDDQRIIDPRGLSLSLSPGGDLVYMTREAPPQTIEVRGSAGAIVRAGSSRQS
jgi:hypothetical protein